MSRKCLDRCLNKFNETNIATEYMMECAIQNDAVNFISQLINGGIKVTDNMVYLAICEHAVDTLSLFLEYGIQPTALMLEKVIRTNNIYMVNLLIQYEIPLTSEMLKIAISLDSYYIADLLLEYDVEVTANTLEILVQRMCDVKKDYLSDEIYILDILIKKDIPNKLDIIKPILQEFILEEAVNERNTKIVKLLIDNGVKPSKTLVDIGALLCHSKTE